MEFNDSTAWTKNSGSGHDAGRYNGKDRGDAVILAILLAWFALAVLSGIGNAGKGDEVITGDKIDCGRGITAFVPRQLTNEQIATLPLRPSFAMDDVASLCARCAHGVFQIWHNPDSCGPDAYKMPCGCSHPPVSIEDHGHHPCKQFLGVDSKHG